MSDPQPVVDKILEILKASSELQEIKQWFLGEPVRTKGYPFGWVEWVGGPVEPGVAKETFKDAFNVVVADRHINEDKAERRAMNYAKKVKDALYADRTLGGLVGALWLEHRAKEKVFDTEDYSIIGIGLTFRIRSRE